MALHYSDGIIDFVLVKICSISSVKGYMKEIIIKRIQISVLLASLEVVLWSEEKKYNNSLSEALAHEFDCIDYA